MLSTAVSDFVASRRCHAGVAKQFNIKWNDLTKWEKISRFEYKMDLPKGFRALGVSEMIEGEQIIRVDVVLSHNDYMRAINKKAMCTIL